MISLQPSIVGPKSFHLNPSVDTIDTTAFAAIDTTIGAAAATIAPYAYTATVSADYDAFNFCSADAGSNIVAGQRVAFGLFLTPDLDKKNLFFQVSGKARFKCAAANTAVSGSFFFGRKATNNTVVSSKAAASNALANYTLLPSKASSIMALSTVGHVNDNIEDEVFSLYLAAGFVYCFGYLLDNYSATDIPVIGCASLSVRKHSSLIIPVYDPLR